MLREALERMPHAGRMQLIGEILSADEREIRCLARDHRGPSYPLRLGGRLFCCALVELGAQAAAAHTSLFGIAAAHTGFVLSLSGVVIGPDLAPSDAPPSEAPPSDAPLAIRAEHLDSLDARALYRFEVTGGEARLVAGDVLLGMQRSAA